MKRVSKLLLTLDQETRLSAEEELSIQQALLDDLSSGLVHSPIPSPYSPPSSSSMASPHHQQQQLAQNDEEEEKIVLNRHKRKNSKRRRHKAEKRNSLPLISSFSPPSSSSSSSASRGRRRHNADPKKKDSAKTIPATTSSALRRSSKKAFRKHLSHQKRKPRKYKEDEEDEEDGETEEEDNSSSSSHEEGDSSSSSSYEEEEEEEEKQECDDEYSCLSNESLRAYRDATHNQGGRWSTPFRLTSLPVELIVMIFMHLESFEDVLRLASVCRLLRRVGQDHCVWRGLLDKAFGPGSTTRNLIILGHQSQELFLHSKMDKYKLGRYIFATRQKSCRNRLKPLRNDDSLSPSSSSSSLLTSQQQPQQPSSLSSLVVSSLSASSASSFSTFGGRSGRASTTVSPNGSSISLLAMAKRSLNIFEVDTNSSEEEGLKIVREVTLLPSNAPTSINSPASSSSSSSSSSFIEEEKELLAALEARRKRELLKRQQIKEDQRRRELEREQQMRKEKERGVDDPRKFFELTEDGLRVSFFFQGVFCHLPKASLAYWTTQAQHPLCPLSHSLEGCKIGYFEMTLLKSEGNYVLTFGLMREMSSLVKDNPHRHLSKKDKEAEEDEDEAESEEGGREEETRNGQRSRRPLQMGMWSVHERDRDYVDSGGESPEEGGQEHEEDDEEEDLMRSGPLEGEPLPYHVSTMSIGYHGSEGRMFSQKRVCKRERIHTSGDNLGPIFDVGETIGCGFDHTNNRIFFTHQGCMIENAGFASVHLQKYRDSLYPSIALEASPLEVEFTVNFGKQAFLFDIDAYIMGTDLRRFIETNQHHLLHSNGGLPHIRKEDVVEIEEARIRRAVEEEEAAAKADKQKAEEEKHSDVKQKEKSSEKTELKAKGKFFEFFDDDDSEEQSDDDDDEDGFPKRRNSFSDFPTRADRQDSSPWNAIRNANRHHGNGSSSGSLLRRSTQSARYHRPRTRTYSDGIYYRIGLESLGILGLSPRKLSRKVKERLQQKEEPEQERNQERRTTRKEGRTKSKSRSRSRSRNQEKISHDRRKKEKERKKKKSNKNKKKIDENEAPTTTNSPATLTEASANEKRNRCDSRHRRSGRSKRRPKESNSSERRGQRKRNKESRRKRDKSQANEQPQHKDTKRKLEQSAIVGPEMEVNIDMHYSPELIRQVVELGRSRDIALKKALLQREVRMRAKALFEQKNGDGNTPKTKNNWKASFMAQSEGSDAEDCDQRRLLHQLIQQRLEQGYETQLYLNGLRLLKLPSRVLEFQSLETLDLGKNFITSIDPIVFERLTNLRTLHLNNNYLESLPSTIGNLVNLKFLVLEQNLLRSIPPEIGNLVNLEKLFLQNNPMLSCLPSELCYLTHLKELTLRNCPWKEHLRQILSFPSADAIRLFFRRYLPEGSPTPRFSWEIPFSELKVLEPLGHGAFSTVYRCLWRGQQFALKKFEAAAVPERQEYMWVKFCQEAGIMSFLKATGNRLHHVVEFYAACTEPPNLCIILELASCGSLASMLRDPPASLDLRKKCWIALEIATAIQEIHNLEITQQICHCDIHSDNILLMDKNFESVKLNDLGLSKIAEGGIIHFGDIAQVQYRGFVKATMNVPFAAPEVLEWGSFSQAADIFSFGIVLWELFTGQKVFAGRSGSWVEKTVCSRGRPSIPSFIPQSIQKVIISCWQHIRTDRPKINEIIPVLRKILYETKLKGTIQIKPKSVHSRRNSVVTTTNSTAISSTSSSSTTSSNSSSSSPSSSFIIASTSSNDSACIISPGAISNALLSLSAVSNTNLLALTSPRPSSPSTSRQNVPHNNPIKRPLSASPTSSSSTPSPSPASSSPNSSTTSSPSSSLPSSGSGSSGSSTSSSSSTTSTSTSSLSSTSSSSSVSWPTSFSSSSSSSSSSLSSSSSSSSNTLSAANNHRTHQRKKSRSYRPHLVMLTSSWEELLKKAKDRLYIEPGRVFLARTGEELDEERFLSLFGRFVEKELFLFTEAEEEEFNNNHRSNRWPHQLNNINDNDKLAQQLYEDQLLWICCETKENAQEKQLSSS